MQAAALPVVGQPVAVQIQAPAQEADRRAELCSKMRRVGGALSSLGISMGMAGLCATVGALLTRHASKLEQYPDYWRPPYHGAYIEQELDTTQDLINRAKNLTAVDHELLAGHLKKLEQCLSPGDKGAEPLYFLRGASGGMLDRGRVHVFNYTAARESEAGPPREQVEQLPGYLIDDLEARVAQQPVNASSNATEAVKGRRLQEDGGSWSDYWYRPENLAGVHLGELDDFVTPGNETEAEYNKRLGDFLKKQRNLTASDCIHDQIRDSRRVLNRPLPEEFSIASRVAGNSRWAVQYAKEGSTKAAVARAAAQGRVVSDFGVATGAAGGVALLGLAIAKLGQWVSNRNRNANRNDNPV